MSEKYEPSQEEIEKAEGIMEAEGLKERSQVEQDAFEVGREAGRKHEKLVANISRFGLSYEKYLELSQELKDVIMTCYLQVMNGVKVKRINGISKVTEENLLECIEKNVGFKYEDSHYELNADEIREPIITLRVVKNLLEKFPNTDITRIHFDSAVENGDINKLIDDLKGEGLECDVEFHREDYGCTIRRI